MESLGADLLRELRDRSGELDAGLNWPREQFAALAREGVLGRVIPEAFGGTDVSQQRLLEGYVELAAACLTTTFILTQRNGACQRIAGSANDSLKSDLLPRLTRGELFATVGISHLTTSRQHWRVPAVQVEEVVGGFRFQGEVPWVTGAPQADLIVTGGTLADGRQVLAAIPTDVAGVQVGPPAKLLALGGSQTSSVRLEQAWIESRWLLAGPVEQLMKQGVGGGTGALATSALAVGLSLAAIEHLRDEGSRRPDLVEIIAPLETECAELRSDLLSAAEASATNAPSLSPESIRGRANSLALRSTQALLAASKGAGFVNGHFAERAVREAMFFLVWSCPQPVVAAALRELAGISTCG
ncbi:MAG: acyl-CoA dehydrogenase [Planctomycetaceae bacterium]|nr:acyl-CoA dehydrogenase [Planctomycetaceae bacterium]